MSDYKQTRDAAGKVTTQYDKMLRSLGDDDLVKDWDEYVESMGSVMGEVEHMAQQMRDRIEQLAAINEELEANLAKAVEALHNVVVEYNLFRKDEYERGLSPLDDEIHDARTTLAELKGEEDE